MGSLALDTDGKLYSWGPNGEGFYRKPVHNEEGALKGLTMNAITQNNQGACAALDRDNKLFLWTVQKRFHSNDLLELAPKPTL